ncbi:MAG: phosphoribosylanthranilate isomerase [Novosphingobium sp.]
MTTPKIKICGISTAETLDAVIAARAEYVGLNFYAPSPRAVDGKQAAMLAARSEGRIARVGVFVEPGDALLAEAIAAGRLDAVQFHGHESPERLAQAKARFGLPVWKAVPVAKAEDITAAAAFAGVADFILFDAKTPKGTLPGGMGLSFDWSLLAAWKNRAPWGLAGGLSPVNVAEAARATGAGLVDTSSGVESAPGVKDVQKIADFCAAVRTA